MRNSTPVLCCLACLLSFEPLRAQNQIRWTQTTAPDGSFSLQQPEGWTAKYGTANVHLSNAAGSEEIVVIRLPRDPSRSPGAYAEVVARSFQQSIPSFQMSNLTTAQDSAAFLVTYNSAGKTYLGPGAVLVKPAAAWWVAYGSLSAADLSKGAKMIAEIARSASDSGSPATSAPTSPTSWSLIGNWGTVGYFGDLVNPSTGTFVQSSYTGEWYTFGTDGTYRYTIAGSGQFITGVVICRGTYEASGNTLRLHQKTESWYPLPHDATRKPMYKDRPMPEEVTLSIEPRSPAEMIIRRGTSTGTFHRDPGSK